MTDELKTVQEMIEYLQRIPNKNMMFMSVTGQSKWISLHFDGMTCDFPYEMDGHWVIVTDGENISVERIKKDAYDHFYPTGRWFALDDVIAWMPLPEPYKGGDNK